MRSDLENLGIAAREAGVEEAFIPAAAPGTIELQRVNAHYESEEAYLFAIADAMRVEYRAIVDAGFVLQVDDPRVVVQYDLQDPAPTLDEYRAFASNQFTLPQTFKGQTVVIVPSSRLAFDGPSTPIQHDAATSAIFYPKFLYGLISPLAGDDRRLIQPVVPSVPRLVVPPAERQPRLPTVVPSITSIPRS